MKNVMLFLLLVSTMISCSDDDTPQINPELNKTWELFSYVAFMDELPEINEGDILWTFDIHNGKLTVENNIHEEHPYMIASGVYNMRITDNTIATNSFEYNYRIDGNTLIIFDSRDSQDGPHMKFSAK